MKKVFFVFVLITSLLLGSFVPVMAKSIFNRKNGEAIVFGLIVNEITQSEKSRQAKRKDNKKNERDIRRNQVQIEMQAERDEYARQKALADLRFQQELERERRYQQEERNRASRGYNDFGCGLDD